MLKPLPQKQDLAIEENLHMLIRWEFYRYKVVEALKTHTYSCHFLLIVAAFTFAEKTMT